jgi:hypothetical protein
MKCRTGMTGYKLTVYFSYIIEKYYQQTTFMVYATMKTVVLSEE